MNRVVLYGAALAGGIGVMTLTADGFAKTVDPFHADHDTFTLNVSLTVTGSSSGPGVPYVQNTINGDVFEVVEQGDIGWVCQPGRIVSMWRSPCQF